MRLSINLVFKIFDFASAKRENSKIKRANIFPHTLGWAEIHFFNPLVKIFNMGVNYQHSALLPSASGWKPLSRRATLDGGVLSLDPHHANELWCIAEVVWLRPIWWMYRKKTINNVKHVESGVWIDTDTNTRNLQAFCFTRKRHKSLSPIVSFCEGSTPFVCGCKFFLWFVCIAFFISLTRSDNEHW